MALFVGDQANEEFCECDTCIYVGSYGYWNNGFQEIRSMGRQINLLCTDCSGDPLPLLADLVVTGASEGIGKGYAIEVCFSPPPPPLSANRLQSWM